MYTCESKNEVLRSNSVSVNYRKRIEKESLKKKYSVQGFLNALNWPEFEEYSFTDLCEMASEIMEMLDDKEVYYQGVSIQKDQNGDVVFYVHLNRMARATSEADDVPDQYLGFKIFKITEGKFYF